MFNYSIIYLFNFPKTFCFAKKSGKNIDYYTVVAANDSNTEILQFDWFISGRIFPVLPAQGREI